MKQERYLDETGEDWIDECARTLTPEEFRGAMKFTIGKYKRRMGKKDPIPKEQAKIADYIERWVEYEMNLYPSKDPLLFEKVVRIGIESAISESKGE